MARQELLRSIAATIGDYRHGEIPAPDAAHVHRWVRQFEPSVQEPLLAELDHVLRQTYLSRRAFVDFLSNLARAERAPWVSGVWPRLRVLVAKLVALLKAGRGPGRTFWAGVNFLDIQRHGASQDEMLALFEAVLKEDHGLTLAGCGSAAGDHVYLDDILFTGNRVILDLTDWLRTRAPRQARVVVVLRACCPGGLRYAHRALLREAALAGKAVRVRWLWGAEFEDRWWQSGAVDGFHPCRIPDDPLARAYVEEFPAVLRWLRVSGVGRSRLFSSEAGRDLLEQQLLLAGLRIRSSCRSPKDVLRPLGYDSRKTFGFGAPIVTYRNCPNNCPLAWWWDPGGRWYPLFPRKV